MGVSPYHNHLLPPQEWEFAAAESVGFTISMFRFLLAFLFSVPIAAIFRCIPTVTCMLHTHLHTNYLSAPFVASVYKNIFHSLTKMNPRSSVQLGIGLP